MAQTTRDGLASSGSFYSRVGVGYPVDAGSSDGTSLAGISIIESYVPGFSNPAHWGSTVFGMATGGLSLNSYSARDNQTSSTNVLFNANYFQIQLPLYRDELGLSVSLNPITRTTYKDISENTIIRDAFDDTLRYATENNGDGGVNRFEVGAGWKISPNVSVGYAGSLVFASIDNKVNVAFQDPAFQPVAFTRQTSGVGFGNRLGLYLEFPNVFNEDDAISFGGTVSFPVNLSGEKVEQTEKISGGGIESITIKDEVGLGSGDIRLPLELGAGVTYKYNLISVSAETQYEQWSDYRSDFDSNTNQLVNRFKTGLGFRYNPYLLNSNKLLSQFKYKLGATYDTGHVQLNGERIKTLMFSFGFGVFSPERNSNSSIDLAFEYGFRGTESQNLVKENIWGISLSLNLAEIFFNRPKLQ